MSGHGGTLTELRGLEVLPRSVVASDGIEVALADSGEGLRVVARGERLAGLEGERSDGVLVGPTSACNAAALRELLPWLRPRPLGLRASVGLGDRLGLATPGHVRALRATHTGIAPIFAQQSIREMDRSGRSAQEVVDDATWGVLAEDWREPFGADADHLKSTADIDRCVPCGYTFFTIDPGDHVDDAAETAERPPTAAREAVARYAGRSFELADRVLTLSEEDVARAAAKYDGAIAHVATMFEHLRAHAPADGFELEVSVDETEWPTTHAQHVYLACELRRRGVEWVSLAPRFVGSFEKGIDYVGNLDELARDLAGHGAIAAQLGPYKLSLHSGSDKLSVYPAAVAATGGRLHVKTSGTSWLEALRLIAERRSELFLRVYALALDRYARDVASYHVSADVRRLPRAGEELSPRLLDDADARRVLHVTFGSVLGGDLGRELLAAVREERERYAGLLEEHLCRHLRALA